MMWTFEFCFILLSLIIKTSMIVFIEVITLLLILTSVIRYLYTYIIGVIDRVLRILAIIISFIVVRYFISYDFLLVSKFIDLYMVWKIKL